MAMPANGQAGRSSLAGRAGRTSKVTSIRSSAQGASGKCSTAQGATSNSKPIGTSGHLRPGSATVPCSPKYHASDPQRHVKGKCPSLPSSKTAKAAKTQPCPKPGSLLKSASYSPPPIHLSQYQEKSTSSTPELIPQQKSASYTPEPIVQQKSASYSPEPIPPSEKSCSPTPRTKPSYKCHICGAQHLTLKSLEIHKKACRRCFEQREAKRPADQRRQWLEEHELPEGFDCLEAYHDSTAIAVTKPTWNPIEEWLASWSCGLGFMSQELTVSPPGPEELCVPSSEEDAPVPDEETKSIPRPKQSPTAAHAPSLSVRHRQKCPNCHQSFRSEVFASHLQICGGPVQRPSKPRQPIKQLCTRTARSQQVSSTTRLHGGKPNGSPCAKREAQQTQQTQVLWDSASLTCRGYIQRASYGDESRLRAELLASIPQAQFVGAFEVLSGQRAIYEAVREGMQQGEGQPLEERELWHGTSWTIVPKILEQGFNRIFAGKHGTLLGIATYFSKDLGYSQRFCDRRGGGKAGTKVAILARVIVGRYCKGCVTDVEPPLVDAASGMRYNSTVDSLECPKIFAVFRDFQAIPLFLVEFKS